MFTPRSLRFSPSERQTRREAAEKRRIASRQTWEKGMQMLESIRAEIGDKLASLRKDEVEA